MRLRHSFCLAKEYFKPHECDRIIALGEALPLNLAGTVPGTDPGQNKRRSNIAWIEESRANKWSYNRVNLYVSTANKQYWHWAMSSHEALQYTTYGLAQYYGWHTDTSTEPYPNQSPWAGTVRKISVTVQSSEPHVYEGGDFMLEDPRTAPDRADERIKTLSDCRSRGTVIMFPSHLFHQVTKVTRGIRRSIVVWYLGPPFT